MTIKLYMTDGSPPCQFVKLVAQCLDLKLEYVETVPFKGDTRTPEFLMMNPQHVVPTLVDEDGFTVWESRTIGRYLVDKYGKTDVLYPKNLKRRINVEKMLDFDLGTLYKSFADYVIPIIFTGASDESKLPKVQENLQTFDNILAASKSGWAADNDMTIADIALLIPCSYLEWTGVNVTTKFENIAEWMPKVKGKIPNFEPTWTLAEKTSKALIEGFKSGQIKLDLQLLQGKK